MLKEKPNEIIFEISDIAIILCIGTFKSNITFASVPFREHRP